MKNLYFILSICIFLVACQGSKHFTKLAAKQEAAGLTTEAANSYYIALQKKRNNIDAQIATLKVIISNQNSTLKVLRSFEAYLNGFGTEN